MGEVRGGCNVFACPCSVQAPIRLKYGRNKEAAMPGAAEGGGLFCQNDECWGSPRKMLSHADRAFHFTQLYQSVPFSAMPHAANTLI